MSSPYLFPQIFELRGCVMLKIVYPICCGMDVHKSFLVACIASINEQGVTTYKGKRFCTFTGDLRRCATWLGENNCKDVCMEPIIAHRCEIFYCLSPIMGGSDSTLVCRSLDCHKSRTGGGCQRWHICAVHLDR